MTATARFSAALALGLGALIALSAAPARADDEDDARSACKEIARNRDWKDVETDVRDKGDRRIVVRIRGERDGEKRERECVFDRKDEKARFDDQ